MAEMWTLGGLSPGELLRRTFRESWEDSIFGQGGRMAFYQFLAIFPCLLVFLDLTARLFHGSAHAGGVIENLSREVFPEQVSRLFLNAVARLGSQPLSNLQLAVAAAGAAWSAMNATWAIVYGLNKAYEVAERRNIWSLGFAIAALTLCLSVIASIALFAIFGGGYVEAHMFQNPIGARITEWLVLIPALLFSFAILYRFAPDLRAPKWQWCSPGATFALILWICAAFGARYYFEHVTDYSTAYGPLNAVVMYLLWLYVTNAAILIGGEMNSEIEKAKISFH